MLRLVTPYQIRRHIPEDSNLQGHRTKQKYIDEVTEKTPQRNFQRDARANPISFIVTVASAY
jgi:hypothetical protein